MATKTQHKFVSVAFRENFNLADLPAEWSNTAHITDGKDSRAKTMLGGGIVFAYRYGALTFVDADPRERAAEIETIKIAFGITSDSKAITEEFLVEESESYKPRVEHNKILLDELTAERRAVIAKTVSQSVAMECYEQLTDSVKSKVSTMVDKLEERGRINMSPEQLYKTVGYAMSIHSEVIGMLHLLDKPDLIWEDKIMDGLYAELRAAFDLGDRFKALEYKLTTIKDNLAILADTVKDARLHRLDFTIVVLILVEIAFSLMIRFHILGW